MYKLIYIPDCVNTHMRTYTNNNSMRHKMLCVNLAITAENESIATATLLYSSFHKRNLRRAYPTTKIWPAPILVKVKFGGLEFFFMRWKRGLMCCHSSTKLYEMIKWEWHRNWVHNLGWGQTLWIFLNFAIKWISNCGIEQNLQL